MELPGKSERVRVSELGVVGVQGSEVGHSNWRSAVRSNATKEVGLTHVVFFLRHALHSEEGSARGGEPPGKRCAALHCPCGESRHDGWATRARLRPLGRFPRREAQYFLARDVVIRVDGGELLMQNSALCRLERDSSTAVAILELTSIMENCLARIVCDVLKTRRR